MVEFPPLSPKYSWWADFVRSVREGGSLNDAVIHANSKLTSLKEFGRFSLQPQGNAPLVLSLAVEGGGRQLRSAEKINDLKLSEHGDWRKIHLGALEAALGRQPFYRYLEPRINKVYRNTGINILKDFNTAIFKEIYSFLLEGITADKLREFSESRVLAERGKEIAEEINKDVSVVQALSCYGKETLIALMAE